MTSNGEISTDKPKRAKPTHTYTEARAIIALANRFATAAEAGARIGVSDTVINDARNKGRTRLVNELAAAEALRRLGVVEQTSAETILSMIDKVAQYCAQPSPDIDDKVWDLMSFSLRDLSRDRRKGGA